MNNVLESFITVNDELIRQLDIENSIGISYLNDLKPAQLEIESLDSESNSYYLVVDNSDFNIKRDSISVHGSISIKNTKLLFGRDNNYSRIALDDTIIGVSLNAYSLSSKYNVSKPIGEINYNSEDDINFQYDIVFPAGALADKLFITINLYVKKVINKSSIFASIEGTLLGKIYECSVNLEGNGSIFPVRIISDKDEPLWYIELNYEDLNDPFSQNNICLILNSVHPDFEKIGSQDITPENVVIWKEVFASFFSQIILSLNSSEKNDIFQDESYSEGSIGLFIQYIIKSLEIDKPILDDPILLNKKLLTGLDILMK